MTCGFWFGFGAPFGFVFAVAIIYVLWVLADWALDKRG